MTENWTKSRVAYFDLMLLKISLLSKAGRDKNRKNVWNKTQELGEYESVYFINTGKDVFITESSPSSISTSAS